MNKRVGIILAAIVAVVAISFVLISLAQGGEYPITVQDPFKGNENAQVVIEEFSDFQCPACAANAPIIAEVMRTYGDRVKFVYRDYPLPSHPKARPAAIAAICAAQQGKFFEYHDKLFADQPVWAAASADTEAYLATLAQTTGLDEEDWQTCRNSRDARREVEADVKEGNDRQVDATPTFFVNGEKITNPGTFFAWKTLLDSKLNAGQPSDSNLE